MRKMERSSLLFIGAAILVCTCSLVDGFQSPTPKLNTSAADLAFKHYRTMSSRDPRLAALSPNEESGSRSEQFPEYDVIDGDLRLQRKPTYLTEEQLYAILLRRQENRPLRSVQERDQESMQNQLELEQIQEEKEKLEIASSRINLTLFATYFCNTVALTLPIVLMPMVAAEQAGATGAQASAFVAATASIATLGGGLGKSLNGFVCQGLGGKKSSSLYLLGAGLCSLLLSFTKSGTSVGPILAGLEFFASIQWTACALILANHYGRDPAKFAAGITVLTLASTSGTLLAKMGGTALLHVVPSWRVVAQIGAAVAMVGAFLTRKLVVEEPPENLEQAMSRPKAESKPLLGSIKESFKDVLGSRLFWQVGLAHAVTFLARSSDKVLAAFFHDATALPRHLCGGLTASVTLGFVHGLKKSQKFEQETNTRCKSRMLNKYYTRSVLAVLGLALCANSKWIFSSLPSRYLQASRYSLAGVIALLSGTMASSLSFQFYHIPPMVSATFGRNKAVCLSLMDGLGFFLSSPIWAATGQIVDGLGKHGWSVTFVMLAALFALGGKIMQNMLPSIIQKQRAAIAAEEAKCPRGRTCPTECS